MKNTKRKRYSEKFKKEAVMRVMAGQNSSTYSVSRELGIISQSMLSKWVKKFKNKGNYEK